MATENVKVIRIDTAPAQTSVKDLRSELKELRSTLLSTKEGTDEYNAALMRSAEIQNTLKEQMTTINNAALDFGQIASNATKVVGGMTAGFQAAQAAMNLFGVENEAVLESLKKMQSLMALTQAFPAIDAAVKGFKGLTVAIQAATGATSKFGKALIATGLGAVLAIIGAIIAHFDEISAWLDKITGKTDFLGEVSDKVVGGIKGGFMGMIQTFKAVGNAVYTYVTAPFQSIVSAIKAFTDTKGGFGDKLKAAGKAMKEKFTGEWSEVGDDFKKIGEVTANAYQEGYESHRQSRLAKNIENAKEDGKKEGAAKGKAKVDAEIKELERLKKEYAKLEDEISTYNMNRHQKEMANVKKEEETRLANLKEYYQKAIISEEDYNKQKILIQKYYAKQIRDIQHEIYSEDIINSAEYVDTYLGKINNELSIFKSQTEALKNELVFLHRAAAEDMNSSEFNDKMYEVALSQWEYFKNNIRNYIDELKKYEETAIKEITDTWSDGVSKLSEDFESGVITLEEYNEKFSQLTEERDKKIAETTTAINSQIASLYDTALKYEKELSDTIERRYGLVTEMFDEAAKALGELSENKYWSSLMSKIGDLTDKWDELQRKITKGGRDAWGAYFDAAGIAFAGISDVLNGFANEMEVHNKEQFQEQKDLQVASTTMSTLAGIATIWATAMELGPIAGPIIGAILSAFMIGIGAAQIAKIQKLEYGGSTSLTGDGSTPSTGAVNNIIAPVQYTQDVQGASIEDSIKNQKVYVTETDITDTQNRVHVAESESRF